jgi:hypothetical protein
MSKCEYVRDYYGVPAVIGRAVIAYGKPGVIAADRGNYIGILLDESDPDDIGNYHPRDGIEYLEEIRLVRKLPKRKRLAKERYQRYLEFGDCFDSFRDFLSWDIEQTQLRDQIH